MRMDVTRKLATIRVPDMTGVKFNSFAPWSDTLMLLLTSEWAGLVFVELWPDLHFH